MEIKWCLYLVINFGILCVAKPVSLNEKIAAESQQKQVHTTTSPKLKEPAAERFSLNKGLKPLLRTPKKFKEIENIIPIGKKTSSLKYRKTFQIKSPLKPKRIKHSFGTRFKRRNQSQQSVKREINGNEKLNEKYIPLLRNLGMLFDNLLGNESGESSELRTKRRRVRYYTATREILCPCSSKSKASAGIDSEEKADTSAEIVSDETSPPAETASETSHPPATSNFRGFRQNKNFPVLLPRNSFSRRRDNYGFGKRSRATYNGSPERYFPGNHGNSELSTRVASNESDAEDDEENTSRDPRHGASGVRSWGILRRQHQTNVARNHIKGEKLTINEADIATDENESTLERSRGVLVKLERQNKQQVRGNETKSPKLLSEPVRGLRGFVPKDKVDVSEHLQPEESKESKLKQNSAGDQRIDIGNGELTDENKEVSTKHETIDSNIVTISHETTDSNIATISHETVGFNNIATISTESSKTEGPFVFIIDGYSVTRNKNGENKLNEKAIHIRDNQNNQM